MDHGDDQAAGSRPSDLPLRMPDVRAYCDDDVVLRSADGEWQIGNSKRNAKCVKKTTDGHVILLTVYN